MDSEQNIRQVTKNHINQKERNGNQEALLTFYPEDG